MDLLGPLLRSGSHDGELLWRVLVALEFGDEVEGDDQQLDGRQDEGELHGDRIGQGALQGRQHGAADQCHHDDRAGGFGVAAVLDGGQGAGVDGRPSRS